ncbi:MAG TPA: ABC transporter substrate-binding protein, partial [Candidatus Binatia bacterium]|nr:ABC transporter substrate-binding protein [Candidatus Binatia bacterium]
MKAKILVYALLTLILPAIHFAEAQQPGKVYRIGYLANPPRIGPNEERLRRNLSDLGYIEGQNLVIEWRFTKGKLYRLPDLAAELVRLKVDCIVAVGVAPTRAAKNATRTIPIVMGNADDDPVRQGLVASLARPGGNVTGFTNIGSDLAGKRLELLKEAFPEVSRVAILFHPGSPPGVAMRKETEIAARALGVKLQSVEVQSPKHLPEAFQTVVKERAEALIITHTGGMNADRAQAIKLAQETRLPAIYTASRWVFAGGLMSYDADDIERYLGVATYVDKILKGAMP